MLSSLLWLVFLAGEPEFLKGQLHLHSSNSGDSATPPADVVRWYRQHGFDFIVFTDHNRITRQAAAGPMLVLPGVELTQNLRACVPPPAPGMQCLLHVNALLLTSPAVDAVTVASSADHSRVGAYRRALATAAGLGAIPQLNHPNFHYAADAALIRQLASEGLVLLEIANGSWDANDHPADQARPSTEAIWDAVLTAGGHVFGTATDDAHHYFDAPAAAARGQDVFTGDRGFVMVRARRDPTAIRQALLAGDFYASTGVLLKTVERTAGRWVIEVDDRSAGPHTVRFIGDGGKVLAEVRARRAVFAVSGAGVSYVRAVVSDGKGRSAWVQPWRIGGVGRAPGN